MIYNWNIVESGVKHHKTSQCQKNSLIQWNAMSNYNFSSISADFWKGDTEIIESIVD